MKKIIININVCIEAPEAKTEQEAIEFAENFELPSGYVSDSFEIIKIIDEY